MSFIMDIVQAGERPGIARVVECNRGTVSYEHLEIHLVWMLTFLLQFLDKEGRTPLMFACTRGDLFEMVLTLLNLGANIKAYQPGTSPISSIEQMLLMIICEAENSFSFGIYKVTADSSY